MRLATIGLLVCLSSECLVAQSFEQGMDEVLDRIETRDWEGALDILLILETQAASDQQHEQLGAKLAEVGEALREASKLAPALRCCEAALAARKRRWGDRDHPDVATSLNDMALCLLPVGRPYDALRCCEESLAMRRRLYGDADHAHVAQSLSNLAYCLESVGRTPEALPLFEASLAIKKRLYGSRDHADVANGMANVAGCLESLGRAGEALPYHRLALEMRRRLFGDDHLELSYSENDVAACLQSLGRAVEALPHFERSLRTRQRRHGDRDHLDVYGGLNNLALCLQACGRVSEALPHFEAALSMVTRLFGAGDYPDLARSHNNLALCLQALGRVGEALPHFELSLAIRKRLYGGNDHPEVANSQNNVGFCLRSLGRTGDALPWYESSLAMHQRLHGDTDHQDVARSLNNVAYCLVSLGRPGEAQRYYEASLAMRRRLAGELDHPEVAQSLGNLAECLQDQQRLADALSLNEAALSMWERLYRDCDHPDVAISMENVACSLRELGRVDDALVRFSAALAMRRRLFGDQDHPDTVRMLTRTTECLQSMGRAEQALRHCEEAVAMIERLRETTRTSTPLRQSLFDKLKALGAFERLQVLMKQSGRVAESLFAAERSRSRELLDLLAQQEDPLREAERRAMGRGDTGTAERARALQVELEAVTFEHDRLFQLLTRLPGDHSGETPREELVANRNAVGLRRRQLLDERARLIGAAMPVSRARTALEIQSVLRGDEVFLEFTICETAAFLYVLCREGDPEMIALPGAFTILQRVAPLLSRDPGPLVDSLRGRDPEQTSAHLAEATVSRQLFESLIPAAVWAKLQASRRVIVAPHRSLHRLPLELLVTAEEGGRLVRWLDVGPPVLYVPSGSVLHWLRTRANSVEQGAAEIDLLAIGDPSNGPAEPEPPERGVFVVAVQPDGQGARVGLREGDVLIEYDRNPLADDAVLGEVRRAVDAALASGARTDPRIPLLVWRSGKTLELEAHGGPLGVLVGKGGARYAREASSSSDTRLQRIVRQGDVDRLVRLPPLRGARAEAIAIDELFAKQGAKSKRLLGTEAAEPVVFDLAAKAKYLHFACHGLAEEYAGQSLSMLVLTQPSRIGHGDDGVLKMDELFDGWRERLVSCELAVLSACRTNVGPTNRDDAPQALPLGFLFAGAPAVISSLWAVDDESTRILMTDFYTRLLAGEADKLSAFTAAKKALRANPKYADPFYWAPFLFIGLPD